MATTNVDIVKISQLTQMDRLTDDDHLLVNDHDPSTGLTETKKILINDLSADIAGRVQLNDLDGVSVSGAVIGNVLKYDGTNWVPATDLQGEGGGGLALTDLSAVTNSVVLGQNSKLTYNEFQGIFTFTPPDLRVSNMDDVSSQTPTTGQFLRWSGSNWYPSSIDDDALTVENSLVPSGGGSIAYANNTLTYTPPNLSSYLTEEIDPIFSASAAASITYSDVANWNSLLVATDDPALGDLVDVNLNGIQTRTGMILSYDETTSLWTANYPVVGNLGDLADVILEYDGAQWRSTPGGGNTVNAGNGLIGGGQGNVDLHVNPGVGINIVNDQVTLSANLENLTNVGGTNGSASTGDVLTWNGFNWSAQPAPSGGNSTTIVQQLPEIPIRMWGYLQNQKGSTGSTEGWQIKGSSGGFSIVEENGFGRVRIVYDTPLPTAFYCLSVTTVDDEGDHFASVVRQRADHAILATKDLEEYKNASGNTASGDRADLMFHIIY